MLRNDGELLFGFDGPHVEFSMVELRLVQLQSALVGVVAADVHKGDAPKDPVRVQHSHRSNPAIPKELTNIPLPGVVGKLGQVQRVDGVVVVGLLRPLCGGSRGQEIFLLVIFWFLTVFALSFWCTGFRCGIARCPRCRCRRCLAHDAVMNEMNEWPID